MRRIIKEGVKTRVLMLSATPVNNRLADLRNQIAFATEGDDTALVDHGIASIDSTTRLAQKQFNRWLDLDEAENERPRGSSTCSGFDYFTLLDLLTIARSRKHIEKYYGTAETGRFPDRLKPINIKSDVDRAGEFRSIREINLEIRRLNLAAYAPLRYVLPAQAGGLRREVQHQDPRRRGLLPPGRPRGEPDPPAARQRPQAHGELRHLVRADRRAPARRRRGDPRPDRGPGGASWRRSTSRTSTSTIRPSRACSSAARSRCCSRTWTSSAGSRT